MNRWLRPIVCWPCFAGLIAFLFLPLMFFSCSVLAVGYVMFESDFETGSYQSIGSTPDGWSQTQLCLGTYPYAGQIVQQGQSCGSCQGDVAPVPRSGSYVHRSEIRPGNQCTDQNDRAEIWTGSTSGGRWFVDGHVDGVDYWMGMSFYAPSSYDPDDNMFNLQVSECVSDGRPCIVFVMRSDHTIDMYFRNASGTVIDPIPDGTGPSWTADQWNDLVVHWRNVGDSSGRLRMWWNKSAESDATFVNYSGSTKNQSLGDAYFKVGLYSGEQSPQGVIFQDAIKLARCGQGEDCFALVSPEQSPPTQPAPSAPTWGDVTLSYPDQPEDPGGFWIPEWLRNIWESEGDAG